MKKIKITSLLDEIFGLAPLAMDYQFIGGDSATRDLKPYL